MPELYDSLCAEYRKQGLPDKEASARAAEIYRNQRRPGQEPLADAVDSGGAAIPRIDEKGPIRSR